MRTKVCSESQNESKPGTLSATGFGQQHHRWRPSPAGVRGYQAFRQLQVAEMRNSPAGKAPGRGAARSPRPARRTAPPPARRVGAHPPDLFGASASSWRRWASFSPIFVFQPALDRRLYQRCGRHAVGEVGFTGGVGLRPRRARSGIPCRSPFPSSAWSARSGDAAAPAANRPRQ